MEVGWREVDKNKTKGESKEGEREGARMIGSEDEKERSGEEERRPKRGKD